MFLDAGTYESMFRVATPLTLAALGGLLCQKAGVFNIALEGFMLIGAFFGIVMVHYSGGSVPVGFLGAIIAGMAVSAIFALFTIKFKANAIITGIAINMLCVGLTSYLLRTMFHVQGSVRPDSINKLSPITLPGINKIPVIGQAISDQSIVTYISFALVLVVYLLIYRTRTGLNISAVGESESAARTAGVSPVKVRWQVILSSGALCGLAGAYLSTVIVSQFSEDMVQGRGFNAFTAVVFANAHPVGTWLVTLLFGLADAIGIRLELLGTNLSPSIVKMFPYALAIVALAISSWSAKRKAQGHGRKKLEQKHA